MKLLFICNLNKHRSKTAEVIFADHYKTRSAGLFNKTPVTAEQLEWADLIFVMEDFQVTELNTRFPQQCLKKRVLCLDIPDTYSYRDPTLIELLKSRVNALMKDLGLLLRW